MLLLAGEGPVVLLAAFLALLPVGPLLACYLWLDRYEPEPKSLLLTGLAWGAFVSTLLAVLIQGIGGLIAPASTYVAAVVLAPVTEELTKGLFLLILLLWRRHELDGVLDGIVYAGMVGVGFAFTENILYLAAAWNGTDGMGPGGFEAVTGTFVLRCLFSPFAHPLFTAFTGIGIGIAVGSRAYERPLDILRDADTAMYRAKAAGKGRHEVFDAAMQAHAIEQLQLESDLRRALARDEIRLLYQPVVALADRSIVGFEALARWKHPARGLLPPSAFLQAAEETGVIVELGFQVLRQACARTRRWQQRARRRRPLSIHVNLSDKQLFQPDLAAGYQATLDVTL